MGSLFTLAEFGAALAIYAALSRKAVLLRLKTLKDERISTKEVQLGAEHYPKWLTKPPRSLALWAFLAAVAMFMMYTKDLAMETFPWTTHDAAPLESGSAQWFGAVFSLVHVLVVLGYMTASHGRWILLSFTMTSWNMIGLHALLLMLSPWAKTCSTLARVVRFPMIMFNTTTFLFWWMVLFPLGFVFLRGKQREGFIQMQVHYGLVNVHFLNFPLAVAHGMLLVEAHPFTFFDAYFGFLTGIAYLLFYLSYMETNGIHFYIILSPRTPLCLAVYGGLAALFAGIWFAANAIIGEHNL